MLRDHGDGLDSGVAECHQSGEAHVLGSYHYSTTPNWPMVEIYPLLKLARREDAGPAGSGDKARTSGALPASGCEQHRASLEG